MPDTPMIAWTMVAGEPEATPDVAVHADGRVRLAPRFGGGELRLSAAETEALRRFVFDEQRVLEIEAQGLERAVEGAAGARRRAAATAAAELVTGATRDAGTTVIRASDGGRTREIRQHDLAGDAAAYPEVDPLQRLRAVELRLLELAERR